MLPFDIERCCSRNRNETSFKSPGHPDRSSSPRISRIELNSFTLIRCFLPRLWELALPHLEEASKWDTFFREGEDSATEVADMLTSSPQLDLKFNRKLQNIYPWQEKGTYKWEKLIQPLVEAK